jgi:hypothetical protein
MLKKHKLIDANSQIRLIVFEIIAFNPEQF